MNKPLRAFTLLECLIVILVIILVGGMITGLLAKQHRKRMYCYFNLKNIGLAFRGFANDNNDRYPMQISTNQGGTAEYTNDVSAIWRHFQAISNELSTPMILICPEDIKTTLRIEASDFSLQESSNRKNTPFNSNLNISYFVGLDAKEEFPSMLLAGDRNIQNLTPPEGTGHLAFAPLSKSKPVIKPVPGAIVALGTNHTTNGGASWTSGIHLDNGYVILGDGSVQHLSSSRLRDQLRYSGDPAGANGNKIAVPF